MRILHVDTGRTLRGGQWQLLLLARGLRSRGIEQGVLARGELLARLRSEGIDAEETTWPRVRAAEADIVHAHDARGHSLAALSWRRRPLIVSRRVAFPVKSGLLSRMKYRRADLYLAVSEFVCGRLQAAGIERNRIRVIYDGGEQMPLSQTGTAILAPRSDDPMKGTVILRETRLPVTYSSNLRRDLATAKVFVYLTYEEGLGSGVLLAHAAGVPVVASRVGGLPEIVEHERTGLLTENEPASVRSAIERLMDDTVLAQRLAENARRQFEARFTVDHMVDATMAVYQEFAA